MVVPKQYRIPILIALCIVALGFFVVSVYGNVQKKTLVQTLELRIAEHRANLIALSELTDEDGADEVIAEIIKDCSVENRNAFDTYLNNLATLSRSELIETERLFDACAHYFSQRKALMVARFGRELEVYQEYVALLALLDARAQLGTYRTEEWEQLVSLEKNRSTLFAEQVSIQYQILKLLQDGRSANASEVSALVTKAREGAEIAGVLNAQIDTLRGSLLEL